MSINKKPHLSLVIPVYNEQDNLRPLYNEIIQNLEQKVSFEILFVDDGSTDNSNAILRNMHEKDNRVRMIQLRRNFGQTAAMAAGFDHAEGETIMVLDGDGQNDPADIPRLLEKLDEGFDIVSGWRKDRKDKALSRKLPSIIANKIIAVITGVKLHDYGCSLKAYRKDVLQTINLYGEMHRFIPAIASWHGADITEMVVNHRARKNGSSKYGLERTVKVLLDLMTVKFLGSYSTKPIYIFGGLGFMSGICSFVSAIAVLFMKYISPQHLSINRNPLLILFAILSISTIQFVLMGLLGEIMIRTYHESQGRPIYAIKSVLNHTRES